MFYKKNKIKIKNIVTATSLLLISTLILFCISCSIKIDTSSEIVQKTETQITKTQTSETTLQQTEDLSTSLENKIIFSSSDNNKSSIYICDPDGGNLTKLISGGIFTSPSWDADHTKIVYTSINPEDGISSIHIYDVKSESTNLLLERFSPMYPSFSPDSKTIIFADFPEKDNENYEIFSVNVDGTNIKRLTNNTEVNFFSKYSPDGNSILFSGEGIPDEKQPGGIIQLYIMDSNGENIRQITDDNYTNNHGIFSPDGHTIIFESNRTGSIELFSMELDGSGEPKNITNNSADNFEANFSPDGKFITYRSNKGLADKLTYDIFVMSGDGSNQKNITQQLKDTTEFNPCWSW